MSEAVSTSKDVPMIPSNPSSKIPRPCYPETKLHKTTRTAALKSSRTVVAFMNAANILR
jgi:hypothetical protein